MKLQGIPEKGISRIARSMKSQDLGEPDYGEGNPEEVKKALVGAEWTSEGWVFKNSISLSFLNLTKLPLIKSVGGSFYCDGNSLISLEGAPKEVGGDFYCSENDLTSLEGTPKEISGDFYCGSNQLISLEGAPKSVGWNFYCENNPGDFTEKDVREICYIGGEVYTEGRL